MHAHEKLWDLHVCAPAKYIRTPAYAIFLICLDACACAHPCIQVRACKSHIFTDFCNRDKIAYLRMHPSDMQKLTHIAEASCHLLHEHSAGWTCQSESESVMQYTINHRNMEKVLYTSFLMVSILITCLAQATSMRNEYKPIKPGQSIMGRAVAEPITNVIDCSRR